MTSATDLDRAIRQATASGQRLPCAGDRRWTSEDRDERNEAAHGCLDCPIFETCGSYARSRKERWNVWGGVDRGRPGSKPVEVPVDMLQRVKSMHEAGLTQGAIAEELGVRRDWVRRRIAQGLCGTPRPQVPHYDAVVELANTSTLSQRGIAAQLGIGRHQVQYAIERARKAGEL